MHESELGVTSPQEKVSESPAETFQKETSLTFSQVILTGETGLIQKFCEEAKKVGLLYKYIYIREGSVRGENNIQTQNLLFSSADKSAPKPTKQTDWAVDELWAHWLQCRETYMPNARGGVPRLDKLRAECARKMLAAGYSVSTLKHALSCVWGDSWHVENNQCRFELVLRDAAHVDKFAAMTAPEPPAPTLPRVRKAKVPSVSKETVAAIVAAESEMK